MHYRTKDCKIDVDKVDEFLELFDGDIIGEAEGNSIELSRTDLSGETKIVVLRRP